MKDLGLLAIDRGLIGRRGHRLDRRAGPPALPLHRVALFKLSLTTEPGLGLARRAERDAIEPVAQQVGIADRAGLAGQHEEDGLEGILGMVAVAQELSADVQDHRAMPRHQGGEGRFTGGIAPATNRSRSWRSENPGDRAAVEERADLTDD